MNMKKIIKMYGGKKVVIVDNIIFRAKKREDWKNVEKYLKKYIGLKYEVLETGDVIYISSDFPDEYANSESRIALKGALAKAKANAALVLPELLMIADNPNYEENTKEKHRLNAMKGWFRYDTRFAIPVHDDISGNIVRYNVYKAKILVRCASDGKKYLYDIISIKKETSSPL